jgi:hypothetical protein
MKKETFACLLFVAILASCSPLRNDISSPQVMMSATPIPVIISTKLATITPLPTSTILSVQTRLPTLNAQNPSVAVKELLENNGGCQLPCWWGVIPGRTNWEDAYNLLSPIANTVYESTTGNPELINVAMFFPAPYPLSGEFRQVYRVKDGIVERIEILPQGYSKYSLPNGLLREFGNPEMIFLGGSIDQPQSFQLILYYPSQGIFALYSNELHPFQQQEILDVCFTEAEITYVDMFLWDPANSFSEALDYIFGQYERPFYEIELVTDLTISEFSDLFASSDQAGCFLTPSSIWRN